MCLVRFILVPALLSCSAHSRYPLGHYSSSRYPPRATRHPDGTRLLDTPPGATRLLGTPRTLLGTLAVLVFSVPPGRYSSSRYPRDATRHPDGTRLLGTPWAPLVFSVPPHPVTTRLLGTPHALLGTLVVLVFSVPPGRHSSSRYPRDATRHPGGTRLLGTPGRYSSSRYPPGRYSAP